MILHIQKLYQMIQLFVRSHICTHADTAWVRGREINSIFQKVKLSNVHLILPMDRVISDNGKCQQSRKKNKKKVENFRSSIKFMVTKHPLAPIIIAIVI